MLEEKVRKPLKEIATEMLGSAMLYSITEINHYSHYQMVGDENDFLSQVKLFEKIEEWNLEEEDYNDFKETYEFFEEKINEIKEVLSGKEYSFFYAASENEGVALFAMNVSWVENGKLFSIYEEVEEL